jgi:serine/threonine protein kinase
VRPDTAVPTQTLPARYRDPEHIGSGGMGEIFRATDQELGRVVAVKVLAERYARDDALRQRFKREALAAARLSGNPNTVTIFDVDEHNGRPLIVMEYLSGGSLEERAHRSSPPAVVLDWLEDAASALDAAHDAGVVHRDVKPGNLILDGRGNVQVADFGIATASGLESFTQAGTILGTAGYLSPEQARGERATDASDRYALAVVAWELLTGHRPFEGESPTAEAAAHVTAPIPSVHAANPSVPAAFDRVFQRALAKDPAARYPTSAEFVGDLRRALHDDAGDTWVVRPPAPPPATRIGGDGRLGRGGGSPPSWRCCSAAASLQRSCSDAAATSPRRPSPRRRRS